MPTEDAAIPDKADRDSRCSPAAPPGAAFEPPSISARAGITQDARHISDPDAPVIIGVSFDQGFRAQQFLLSMSGLRESGVLDLKDAVVVNKDQSGSVKVVETIDPTMKRSAFSGAVWTGLLGLFIGGPVGWLAGIGVGAGAGAIAAKVIDLGIPDDWVDWFKNAVRPGTSTVVILAEHVHVQALAAEATRFPGAELLYTTMSDSAFEQLTAAFDASD